MTEEAIKAELKLARIKDEIKALEEQKKKLLNELKIVQIYEELNEKAQLFSKKVDDMKNVMNDFAKLVSPTEEDKKKVYQSIDDAIKTGKEIAESLKLLAKAVLKK
jgi:DNA repair exonuclease SbcCD ATPase subunit